MPLIKIFEKDFDNLPWKIYAYAKDENKCDVFEFLKKGVCKNQQARIMQILRGLSEFGPAHYSKPTFGVAAPKYDKYNTDRIAVNQRRIYVATNNAVKEIILIIGRNKKTQKTSEKHIKEFQHDLGKLMKERGELQ